MTNYPTSPMSNALSAPASSYLPKPSTAAPKAKKKDAAAGDNRGELSCIRIEFTENGSEVISSYEPLKINPKMDRYSQMPEDKKMSFEGTEAAKAYVNTLMDGAAGSEAGETPGASDQDNGAGDDSGY